MQWEYQTVKLATGGFWAGGVLDEALFNDILNGLGRKGWELVSTFDTNMNQGATRDVVAVFKRPLGA